MQRYVKIWTQYAHICRNMHKNMQKYVISMHLYAVSRKTYAEIYKKYAYICKYANICKHI